MPANLENSAVATGLVKSVFIPIPKKGNAKECSNYHTIALISHPSKVTLKILQDGLQRHVNRELSDVMLDSEKAEEPEIKLPTSVGSLKKQESSRKTSISALLIMPKPLTVWVTRNCGNFWKRWEYQTTWPASKEIWIQVKKQQLELDMEQQTGSKLGKELIQGCILSPCLFILIYIMWNARLDETQAGVKIAGRNINNPRYADDTTLMAESEELTSLLKKVKEESEKVGLKLNIQKTKIMAPGPITSWQIDGETWKQSCESESEVAQSYPTLSDPMDCRPPGSSIHGILQARILEWVAISFSRRSSVPRD